MSNNQLVWTLMDNTNLHAGRGNAEHVTRDDGKSRNLIERIADRENHHRTQESLDHICPQPQFREHRPDSGHASICLPGTSHSAVFFSNQETQNATTSTELGQSFITIGLSHSQPAGNLETIGCGSPGFYRRGQWRVTRGRKDFGRDDSSIVRKSSSLDDLEELYATLLPAPRESPFLLEKERQKGECMRRGQQSTEMDNLYSFQRDLNHQMLMLDSPFYDPSSQDPPIVYPNDFPRRILTIGSSEVDSLRYRLVRRDIYNSILSQYSLSDENTDNAHTKVHFSDKLEVKSLSSAGLSRKASRAATFMDWLCCCRSRTTPQSPPASPKPPAPTPSRPPSAGILAKRLNPTEGSSVDRF